MAHRAQLILSIVVSSACTPVDLDGKWDGEGPSVVDPDRVLGLLVQPEAVILPMGHTVQLRAIALDLDHEHVDLTHMVDWSARDVAVAGISSELDEEGLLRSVSPGTTLVEASWEGLAGEPVRVDVTDAQLERLTVTPDAVQLTVGDSVELSAFGSFTDGASGDLSGQVRWHTDDPDVARIDENGRLTTAGAGRAEVWASWDEQESEAVSVDVVEPETVEPAELGLTAVSGRIEDGRAEVSATVINRGQSSATDFFVEVYADPGSSPEVGDVGQAWDWVDYLGPGESTTVDLSFTAWDSEHELVLLVDSGGTVVEANEADNTFSTTITEIAPPPSGPDIVVDRLSAWTESGRVFYELDITNHGNESAGWFYVDIYTDRSAAPTVGTHSDSFTSLSSLAAGATTTVTLTTPIPSCSPCTSWALADSYDTVAEVDEFNNTWGPLTVWP